MTIQSTIPVLASLNIDETLRFYVHELGFTERGKTTDYLMVSRDGAEIHFWLCAERHIAENTSCYIRVANADALYDEFKTKNIKIQPPAIRPWGMKELYVIDPSGNLLKFGQDV